jgi:hypothetical protein
MIAAAARRQSVEAICSCRRSRCYMKVSHLCEESGTRDFCSFPQIEKRSLCHANNQPLCPSDYFYFDVATT